MKKRSFPGIKGHLEIFAGDDETGREVLIHGDPEGLRSLARLLEALAGVDQSALNIPDGCKEHVHLDPDRDISASSWRTIVGRLDGKGTGEFHDAYKAKKHRYRDAT